MDNKKIIALFVLMVICFSMIIAVLIKQFDTQRVNDIKKYEAMIKDVVRQENDRVIVLSNQLAIAEKENIDLKNTLTETRNSLELLGKK